MGLGNKVLKLRTEGGSLPDFRRIKRPCAKSEPSIARGQRRFVLYSPTNGKRLSVSPHRGGVSVAVRSSKELRLKRVGARVCRELAVAINVL
jgi:hypothetical protein